MKKLPEKQIKIIIVTVIIFLISLISVVAVEVKDGMFYLNTPTYIELNTVVSGYIENEKDYEAYLVTVPKDGALSLSMNHEDVADSIKGDFKISIYYIENAEEDWYEYRQLTYHQAFMDDVTSTWGETGVKAGTYCVVVEPGSALLFNEFEIMVSFSPTNSFEKEFNDTKETATPINLSSATSQRVVYGSSGQRDEGVDTDYYKFVLREDSYVDITFKHPDDKLPQVSWVVSLLTENGEEISSFASKLQDPELSTGKITLHAGTYYISVESQIYSDLTYVLRVESGSPDVTEFELNDSPEKAELFPENTLVSGRLAPKVMGLDKDYYKLTLTEESYVTVEFKHELEEDNKDYNGWNVRLLRPESDGTYTEIVKRISKWNDEGVSITGMGLPKGDYYILVDADSMNYTSLSYSLSYSCRNDILYEKESNNTKETANEVKVKETYYGTLISTDMDFDRDYYKFVVENDTNIAFQFCHDYTNENSLAWIATITDENGNEIKQIQSSKNEHVVNTGVVELEKGTYYILIENDLYSSEDTYWFIIYN